MYSLSEIAESICKYKEQQILDSGENDMFDNPIMKKYKIIYCFLDKNNAVQTDDYGCEMYFDDEVEAPSKAKAIEQFKEQFMYDDLAKPEIMEIIRR